MQLVPVFSQTSTASYYTHHSDCTAELNWAAL